VKRSLIGQCAHCDYREACVGGCLAEKLSQDRGLGDAQPVCIHSILEGALRPYDAKTVQALTGNWFYQLQRAAEDAGAGKLCMRQAPYWRIWFRPHWRRSRGGETCRS
jgi:hypothetical protein